MSKSASSVNEDEKDETAESSVISPKFTLTQKTESQKRILGTETDTSGCLVTSKSLRTDYSIQTPKVNCKSLVANLASVSVKDGTY